jgi:phosphatidylserine/phosphatidylglycerophosphate/cardiolipin synthase-like enzyme
VLIYTDRQLDLDSQTQKLKPSAAAARKLLRESGAEVQILSRVHNKTLCVDDTTIVIGSFNWLSAVRDESHRYQRQENSIKYEGPGVSEMITDVLTEMQSRQVPTTESKLFA